MKYFIISIILCMSACKYANKKTINNEVTIKEVSTVVDTMQIDSVIQAFNVKYARIRKEISDSVVRVKPNSNDFSDYTTGIEAKYNACNDNIEKILTGYELAQNYMVHFDSSKNPEYLKKAEPLFVSFISYDDGVIASRYLKLDHKKVRFMQKNWKDFSEQERETLLLYGLLRGFEYGLPDVLKNIN